MEAWDKRARLEKDLQADPQRVIALENRVTRVQASQQQQQRQQQPQLRGVGATSS